MTARSAPAQRTGFENAEKLKNTAKTESRETRLKFGWVSAPCCTGEKDLRSIGGDLMAPGYGVIAPPSLQLAP